MSHIGNRLWDERLLGILFAAKSSKALAQKMKVFRNTAGTSITLEDVALKYCNRQIRPLVAKWINRPRKLTDVLLQSSPRISLEYGEPILDYIRAKTVQKTKKGDCRSNARTKDTN